MNRWLLLRKAMRDLRRRRSQIAAVALTVFLGIGLFVANNDAARNLSASYQELYERLDFADVWATGGSRQEVSVALFEEPEVTAVDSRTRIDAPIRIGERQLVGTVIGMPTDDQPVLNKLMMLDGRYFAPGDETIGATIVEQHARDEFDLGSGDAIAVLGAGGWRELEVVGAAASAEYVWLAPSRQQIFTVPDEFAVIFVPESIARQLAPTAPLQLTAAVADHDPDVAARLVDNAIAAGATDAYSREQQASNTALQGDVQGFEQLSYLFPVLFLTVAGMAAYVLLSRLVRTERTQIGMMVANGMSTGAIRLHYTTHALVAVLLGVVPGVLVGIVLGRAISGMYTGFLDIPITVTEFSAQTILASLAFAVVVTALAGGLPARAAAQIAPAQAMRPPAPARVTRRSLVERLWPGRMPQSARMVLRNVTRSRRRFLSTVTGVVLALMLIITSLGMADTVFAVFDRQFGEVDLRDLTVTYDAPVDDGVLARLEARPEIATAERFVEAPIVLSNGDRSTDQLLQVFETDTAAHGFDAPLPAEGIVLSGAAADELAVGTGDSVGIAFQSTSADAARLDVPVVGLVDEPVPSVSYASMEAWTALGAPDTNVAVVTLVDRADHRAARDALQAEPGVAAVVDQRATAEALEQLMGLTYVFIGLMVAFAVIMSIALVYNMVSVSLAERTGEVATLRANGVSHGFIRRTLTAENLLTILAGVIPGGILGVLLARLFLQQFETESMVFDFVLHNRSLLLSVVLVVVAALVAQVPGMRMLRRLNLAEIVRERSE